MCNMSKCVFRPIRKKKMQPGGKILGEHSRPRLAEEPGSETIQKAEFRSVIIPAHEILGSCCSSERQSTTTAISRFAGKIQTLQSICYKSEENAKILQYLSFTFLQVQLSFLFSKCQWKFIFVWAIKRPISSTHLYSKSCIFRRRKKCVQVNAGWCLHAAFYPQIEELLSSQNDNEISGFCCLCRSICSFLVRLFSYYRQQSVINSLWTNRRG